ncbi:hypothetical protein NCS52_00242600 [Fusarium sp. LHS14.1]|nr:hypothetical protein NCS52_00242600 [Fusarium sp. LHS14.1]
METQTKAQDGSPSPTSNRAATVSYLEKLDFQPAESREPETKLTKADQLAADEILLYSDLIREWTKIEEGSGESVVPTKEVMANFFRAAFYKWDSGCAISPLKKSKPKITKEEKGVIVGEWSKDLGESRAARTKRKKEGSDQVKFGTFDSKLQVAAGTRIKYLPGMTQKKAEIQIIHLFDQAEIMRVDTFNKNILAILARMRLVDMAKNGHSKHQDPLEVNPKHSIGNHLAERKYLKQHLVKDTVEHVERFTGVFGDSWEDALFPRIYRDSWRENFFDRVFKGSSKALPYASPSSS